MSRPSPPVRTSDHGDHQDPEAAGNRATTASRCRTTRARSQRDAVAPVALVRSQMNQPRRSRTPSPLSTAAAAGTSASGAQSTSLRGFDKADRAEMGDDTRPRARKTRGAPTTRQRRHPGNLRDRHQRNGREVEHQAGESSPARRRRPRPERGQARPSTDARPSAAGARSHARRGRRGPTTGRADDDAERRADRQREAPGRTGTAEPPRR